jgi:hypothetical protein
LLSVALGKVPSAKIRSVKASLPRAVYRALGKAFAESPTLGKARNKKKASLPRAVYRALGKAFAESPTLGKA